MRAVIISSALAGCVGPDAPGNPYVAYMTLSPLCVLWCPNTIITTDLAVEATPGAITISQQFTTGGPPAP